jgi:hypothetical protein
MTWFDRLERIATVVAIVCSLYIAVIFGQFIALLIQSGMPQ